MNNGDITNGNFKGNVIDDAYIASATIWNNKQSSLTNGISDTNNVIIDSADVNNNEYAKFTNSGLESKSFMEVKTDLDLHNIDNTSDANKPISSATQTALNLKVSINNPVFNGVISGFSTIDYIDDVDTSTVAPTIDQVLTWSGTKWYPKDATTSGASSNSFSNIDINGGTIDGVTIGNSNVGVGKFSDIFCSSLNLSNGNISSVGNITLLNITGDGGVFNFNSDWNASGHTCSNLGTITTCEINGGSINGTTLGLTTPNNSKFIDCTITNELLVESNVVINGDTNNEVTLKVKASNGQTSNILEVLSFDSNTKYLNIINDGKIGINNDNPTYNLDITGDINFTGNLTQNGNPFTGANSLWSLVNTNEVIYDGGFVGIGTNNPDASLHIVGTRSDNNLSEGIHLGHVSNDYGFEICSLNGNNSIIDFKKTNNDFDGRIIYNHSDNNFKVYVNNNETLKINENDINIGKSLYGGYLNTNKNFNIECSDNSTGNLYINNNSQRPTIIGNDINNTSGGLGIGTIPEIGVLLDVYGNINCRGELIGGHNNSNDDFHIKTTNSGKLFFNFGNTNSVYVNNVSLVTSDNRTKHNEILITNGLDVISNLNLYKYDKTIDLLDENFNGSLNDLGIDYTEEIGFIAQQVNQINELQSSVEFVNDRYVLKYNTIFCYTVQAVKELKEKNDLLENEVSTLKTQYNDLLSRITALENN